MAHVVYGRIVVDNDCGAVSTRCAPFSGLAGMSSVHDYGCPCQQMERAVPDHVATHRFHGVRTKHSGAHVLHR
jgi:hypothetical protein